MTPQVIKIGMLFSPEIVAVPAEADADYSGPVMRDPVLVAKSVDALLAASGTIALEQSRVTTWNTHDTGCSLSSAITAELAKGAPLEGPAGRAQVWLHGAICAADDRAIGGGHGPVHHFHGYWP
ncbi:Phosphomethylpyrimidine kinase [Primorskyibacter flagellatus]|uniref:Phosphomethylpyrimidine kinase n=2 Tax=Primorskyibacter flagellatus TaxID=1387277 RepID=A0A1W2DNF2_9RHOB|nr:Phosphomethylpyrimidine kinase [Primorskyibacter flagellatus]